MTPLPAGAIAVALDGVDPVLILLGLWSVPVRIKAGTPPASTMTVAAVSSNRRLRRTLTSPRPSYQWMK